MILYNKRQVRSIILAKRNNFINSNSAKLAINQGFWQNILPLIQPKSTIAAYFPIGSELNIIPLLRRLSNYNFNVALPVIKKNNEITFYPWLPGDIITPGNQVKKILEPFEQKQNTIPNIIITPLIACDLNGNRIGSGKGMYDKYINNMKSKALCIGLCYDFQLLNEIPTEPHDKPLDLILTDKRFIKI